MTNADTKEGSIKSFKDVDLRIQDPISNQEVVTSDVVDLNLVRKIDRHLLPFMFISYMLQYLDKTTLGYAAVTGIEEDTHLVGQNYSWASSVFYFGYLTASYPASFLFVKFPLAKVLGVSMVLWSIILTCHGAAQNFVGLMVLRSLLGATESVISPGFSLLTGMWYNPSEHASRHAIWFSGNGVALMFGSLLGFGISHAKDTIAPWRLIFIIFGIITLAWSVVILLFLPDSASNARFLNEDEKAAVIDRAQKAQHTAKTGRYNFGQVLEALIDPKTWLMFAYTVLSSLPNGCFTNFTSLIISGFGFNRLTTILLSMPSAAFQLSYVFIGALISAKFPNARCYAIAGLNTIGLIGCILIRQLSHDNKVGRLFGIYFFGAYAGGFPISLSLVASNTGGFTKKGTVTAVLFLGYCAGNIGGPQMFLSSEAPQYPTAFTGLLACFCLAVVSIIILRIYMGWENRRRDTQFGPVTADGADSAPEEIQPDTDETDWTNKSFRYHL